MIARRDRSVPLPLRSSARRRRMTGMDPIGLVSSGLATPTGLLIAAAVVLAPMNHVKLDSVYVTASDIVALMAFILMLANRTLSIKFFGPATAFWFMSFFAFMGGLTVSSVVNGNPLALPNTFAQYGYSLLVLPMILGGRSYAQTIALVKLLVASYVFVMVFGAYVVHFVDNPNHMLVSGSGRMRSLFQRENEGAVHGAIAIVLVLGLYKMGEFKLRTVFLCLPPLIYGIMLTGSVSGLLATILGVTLLITIVGPFKYLPISAAAFIAIAGLMVLLGDTFMPAVFQERVLNPLLDRNLAEAGTFSDRAQLMQEALTVAKDTVFLGLGVEQFREISSHHTAVHNTYLLSFVEGGLISMLGLIGFFLSGVILIWAAIVERANRLVWAITLVVLLIYAAAFNMFPTFFARFWNVPWILLFSLTAATLRQTASHPHPPNPPISVLRNKRVRP